MTLPATDVCIVALMPDYRKLRVWAEAHDLAVDVRKITETFPRTGYAELKSQMTTAAESVVLTIVEALERVRRKSSPASST